MSTTPHTPTNTTKAVALVAGSHGEQIALITAILRNFSPETRARTLQTLREHDLDPVWNFEVTFRLTLLRGEGPAEAEKNYQERYSEEVNGAMYDCEESALEEAISQAFVKFKEDHRDCFLPGWQHVIESALFRRFDPYTLTMTNWASPPKELMVSEIFTLEG